MSGGCIRVRGPDTWELRFELPRGADGKRRTRTVTFKGLKSKAAAELRRLMREVDENLHAETDGVTVAGWLFRWLVAADVSPRTRERYKELCDGFIAPRIGALALDKLDSAAIQGMMTELASSGRRDGKSGGLSPTTRRHVFRCLCTALNSAVELGALGRNPCDRLRKKLPRAERRELTVLSSEKTAEVLVAIRERRIYWPTLLAVATGARRSEVLALAWRNLDLDRGVATIAASIEVTKDQVRIKPPKNGRSRAVTLPAFAVAELRRRRTEQAQELLKLRVRLDGNTLVCARADGSMMLPSSLSHEWEKVAPTIDGRKPRFHDLRHGNATQLLAAGVPIKVVSERLGHCGIAITADIYAHVTTAMQEEAAQKLDIALSSAITRGSAGAGSESGSGGAPGPAKCLIRSVAQLVEHRSPKPGVGGSSPSTPATSSGRRI